MNNMPKRVAEAIGEVDVEGCWASVMHILRNEDEPYPEDEAEALQHVALNLFSLSEQALTYAVKMISDDIHGEHPLFSRRRWEEEAECGDTQLGYWQWVFHNMERMKHAAVSRNPDGG